MAKKIFISPSNQTANEYAYGNTTEDVQCGKIGRALEAALKRCGFETKFEQYDTMQNRVAHSNSWNADMHICVHTNAFNGQVTGVRCFYYSENGYGNIATKKVYDELVAISPVGSHNIKAYSDLYELRKTTATAVYCECNFHDNVEMAKWIIAHTTELGEAICKGVCKYYGVAYVAPVQPTNVLYRVQVGAYAVKANAEAMQKKLKSAGYEAIIVEVKK